MPCTGSVFPSSVYWQQYMPFIKKLDKVHCIKYKTIENIRDRLVTRHCDITQITIIPVGFVELAGSA